MSECAVCLERTDDVLVPCAHAACRACVSEWLARKPTCPVCRAPSVIAAPPDDGDGDVRLRARPGAHVGITLRGEDGLGYGAGHALEGGGGAGGPSGLRVVRTERGDLAHAHGVRRGDVVTHVNGVSARTARATTELIDTATAHACDLVLSVRTRAHSRGVSGRWWCV